MEILLKQGDRLPIPEGCKAVIEGNLLLIKKKESEFKRGDVIVSKMNEILIVDVCSFEKNILRSFVHIKEDGTLSNSSYSLWNVHHTWRLATEEEKQLLFDKMKEKGFRWNAEEKKVEKIRWRAEKGNIYYIVSSTGIVRPFNEEYDSDDVELWRFYNYFHTREKAEKAAEVVKEALRKFHEENE